MPRGALVTLAAIVACGRAETPSVGLPALTEAQLATRAHEDFVRSCAPCHGRDGRGDIASHAPDLTRLAERLGPQFSSEYVRGVISGEREVAAHGRREMPVWQYRFGRVESGAEAAAALWAQRRLDALAIYVESLQASPASREPR